jgi:RNA polymerase sigma-70 factor (ECF subfamily)
MVSLIAEARMKPVPDETAAAAEFDRLLVELRPKLHRYCARMTGSVIDGEDVLQDALIKAVEAFLDFLRRLNRQQALRSGEEVDMIADTADEVTSRQIAGASLRTFMRLPVAQRSPVILMDVLGYSLQEVGEVMGSSLAAVKAALHRGRMRLQELADEPDDLPLAKLPEEERARLGAYVRHFNSRDFDAIRGMIADDVRLDLVNRTRINGKAEVSRYFGNYEKAGNWHLLPGLVEGLPAILVFDPDEPGSGPKYFVLLQWSAGKVATIRDFRHAPYVIDGAQFSI